MTLEEVFSSAESIISTVATAQNSYHDANGSYECSLMSHDVVPPSVGRVPTNDHYSVGTIPFRFKTNIISRNGVKGWFIEVEVTNGGILYRGNISGAGVPCDMYWMRNHIS